MPNYLSSSPWADAAQTGNQISSSLGQIMLRLPQLRAQQAMVPLQANALNAEANERNAAAGQYQARTGLLNQQRSDLQTTAAGIQSLQGGLASMWQKMQAGQPASREDIGAVTAGVVHMAKNNPQHLADFLERMIAMQGSGMGTNQALAAADLMHGANKLTVNTPMGGTTTPVPGVGMPTVVGQPKSPATAGAPSAALGHLTDLLNLLQSQHAGNPTNSMYPIYSQTTNALPRVLSQIGGTNAAPAAPEQRIRVRSKDNKIGSIPVSQLQQALSEGYTQVQ